MARRNTGSIKKVREGVYQVTVDVSKTQRLTFHDWAAAVKRTRRYETIEGTREEAERRLHEMLVEADRGAPKSTWTFGQFLDWWLDEVVAVEQKPGTLKDYRGQVHRHVKPKLGHIRITDVQPYDLQMFQNHLAREKNLSPSSVHKVRQIVSGAFTKAIANRLITFHPLTGVKPPKRDRMSRREAPSTERVQQILEALAGHKHFAAFWLYIHTGMRPGEALGLYWEDIDLAGGMVHVRRTVVTNVSPITVDTPKTKRSSRAIPIDEETVAVLAAHRDRQDARREKLGERYEYRGLVFPGDKGKLMWTGTLRKALKKIAPELTTHQLRHYFATGLAYANVPIASVSALLGHADATTTNAFYIHPLAPADREGIGRFSAKLRGSNGGGMAVEEAVSLLSTTNFSENR